MIGLTVSRYRITGQLGAGGMGIVYAAQDPRLGRDVALKFVPEDLARDHQALERLRSEARTASGLNHANICTIYDIDEYEGRPFIVMELLKGQTLRDRLTAGRLKIREVVDIGIQVSDALDSAHGRDVIHRDIKPANLFIVDRGQIKILDFGLAKQLESQPAESGATTEPTRDQTAEGVTLGTVAYMSPEQVTGEPLDGRTDLFSLGVVLYECLTGHPPFTGKTSALVFSAILNRAPVAPVVFNPEIPPGLQEVVNNCLEKDRELRYQDAAGLRADLRRVKRDFESGRSGVVKIARSDADSDSRVPTEHLRARNGVRGTTLAAAVILGVTLAVAAAASYFVSSRRPGPSADLAGQGSTEALIRTRLGLATTSLDARNYRAALAYSEDVLRSVPDHAEAIRIRDAAGAMLKRFDDAVATVTERLAAGDTDGAASALNTARSIDPTASVVGELAAQLGDQLKTQTETARREATNRSRTPSPRQAPVETLAAPPQSPPPTALAAPTPIPPSSTPSSASVQQAPPPAPTVAPGATQTAPPDLAPQTRRPETPSSAATPPVDDDDVAIRRVVSTYARAIETKDLALFRSVKPNLSAAEQRRIEEGFRAVSSQQVAITILSIEKRGQEASVRLSRRDTIQAGGRARTTESQQTMTLTRGGGGWVVREIGQ